ncbi:MAG: acyl-CoA dehydrogenase C-terminal domain-containing protein [Hyphomicrobiales bacterium]
MPTYKAPVDDTLFILNDVLKMERYNNLPGFEDASPDMVEAILRETGRFSEEELQPINLTGDQEGCVRNDDGSVKTPSGFKEAFNQFAELGMIGMVCDPDYGGQGLPYILNAASSEYTSSANMAWSMYHGLTQGAIAAIQVHADDEQKQKYLPNMIAGQWSGTMNLTEPHCGTDLGLIKSKAVPQDDGSYKISGQKIFISAGEQDITENIIHLVLARIEGAPEGTKGISLFIVPKFHISDDGEIGDRNPVSCGSLEEKMGIHGNSTCVMNYDEATGYLIGEENKGLRAMFTMMNEARLGVGVQGLSQSEVAYQNAVVYANDRVQGRSLTGDKNPELKADPLMVHPDVRRTLLRIKAFNEGARAFVLWTALKGDIAHRSEDEKERAAADDLMGLLTPVIKGVLTDVGFDNTVSSQQMYGGHGYVAEWGMEQFVRDARIAMIYEGANGVQALDLVGRKLPKDGGKAVMAFFGEVETFIKENADNEEMTTFTAPLKKGLGDLQAATMWFMQNAMANPDNAGAGSVDYMHMFGTVAIGYMWAQMAQVALEKAANDDNPFYQTKLITGRFYMERMLPETTMRLARISSGSETLMSLPADQF